MTDLLCSPWATFADIPEASQELVSEEEWEALLLWASEILWALSGRQWSGGGCEAAAMIRPCPPAPGTQSWPFSTQYGWGYYWPVNGWAWAWGPAPYVRRQYKTYAVELPHDEVSSITSVTIAGEPFTAFRLEVNWLERTDGRGWATCFDDVVIVYEYGLTPPAAGVRSAVTLAIEAAKQASGDGTCRLPRRVVSVTRQGVTMAFVDPMQFLRDGFTGLPDVDLWLASVNPYGRPSRATVWSPDLPRTVSTPVPPGP